MLNKLADTIAAVSTPNGPGAIGIIRLSGNKSFIIAKTISKKCIKPGLIQYSSFFDKNDNILDVGIILAFKKPKSFTGEDLIEFHTHGSDLILNALILRLISLGARLAEPGEFTFRAFLNNKLDLVQAESINLLIKSKNLSYNNFILKSLLGSLSKKINNLLTHLLELRDKMEAYIEFPDDVQLNINNIQLEINSAKNMFNMLFNKLYSSHLISNKYKIIILGDTNVGKSSFFNFLLKNNRAITSNTPGTTRDFIESNFIVNDFEFTLLDTAGFNKETTSHIEKCGITKTLEQINDSSIIIFMFDISIKKNHLNCKSFNDIFNKYKSDKKFFVLKNKIDITNDSEKIIFNKDYTEIYLSIEKSLGVNLFLNELKKILFDIKESSYIISKEHYTLFLKINNIFTSMCNNNKTDSTIDINAEKIKTICNLLMQILGKNASTDVITNIFSKFCIGK